MIPMNLLKEGQSADYINTGTWSTKAIKEANIVARCSVAASTEDEGFARLPRQDELKLDPDAAYVHFTSNNTIKGTQWHTYPRANVPLICDMSSDIMWRQFDVNRFGFIYAGAQKNLGPSGVTMVIIRDDFLEMCRDDLTSYLNYGLHASKNSLFNTPPTFGIYLLRNVMDVVAPTVAIITETNVPHEENIKYFGEPLVDGDLSDIPPSGDEAQLVYQFSLSATSNKILCWSSWFYWDKDRGWS